MPAKTLFLATALLCSAPLAGWGAAGHEAAAAAALNDLPPGPAAWFAGQESVLRDHANDPDHWKHTDPLERPRHYLECEPYGGPARVPLDEDAARAMLGPALFQASGQLPWAILARVRGLARAFASGDPAQAALAAAILSHYVADLCVPLHTTVDRHGDRSGQHGVHKRWEVGLLDVIMDGEGWLPEVRPATLGPDPLGAPWAWLRDSFSLVPGVLSDDLAAQRADPGGFGEAYWQAFGQSQIPHVKEQLTLAGQRTARMILLAWTRAGSPAAPHN